MPAIQGECPTRARGVPEIAGEPRHLRVAEEQSHRFVAHRSRDRGVAADQIVDHVRVPRGLAQEPRREHRVAVHEADGREGRDGHASRPEGAHVRSALLPQAGPRRLQRDAAQGQDPGADGGRDAQSLRRVPHVHRHKHTEAFGGKGIDGPGHVVYGTTPHFKGQPPTESYNGIVPLFAWAKVCACENKGGRRTSPCTPRRDTFLEDRVVRGEDVRGRQGCGGEVRRSGIGASTRTAPSLG